MSFDEFIGGMRNTELAKGLELIAPRLDSELAQSIILGTGAFEKALTANALSAGSVVIAHCSSVRIFSQIAPERMP